ncbi:MAG: NUDIX hydrolase [Nocardioidaceae bacterium]
MQEHLDEFLATGRAPQQPRAASTVLLLRDTTKGPEVYLLRRHSRMPFAAGMFAFPGGAVDPRDADRALAWAGPPPEEWAERLRCDEAEARALVCAAVRETFEESGVLLTGETRGSVVADTTGEDWERDRVALVARTLSFADLLQRRDLVLRSDLLLPWAHWITPEFEPRRYDTRFFVAALPAGQLTRDVSGEADQVAWVLPAQAVADADAGLIEMLPPTYVTLSDLVDHPTTASILAAARDRVIETVLPRAEIVDGATELSWRKS